MKTAERLTGILTGIFIMLIFCTGFRTIAVSGNVQTEYSPDENYKYESECIYEGILIDFSELDNEKIMSDQLLNPSYNMNIDKYEPFTGEVQLSERLNYIYQYTEEDNVYFFRTGKNNMKIDIDYILKNGLEVQNDTDADLYIKRIQTLYKIYDKECQYSHTIRIYMNYAEDLSFISGISDKVISVSDALVDEEGSIYYDICLDESTDIEFAKDFIKNFWGLEFYKNVCSIEFLYDEISCSERYISFKPDDYEFEHNSTDVTYPTETTTLLPEPSQTTTPPSISVITTTVSSMVSTNTESTASIPDDKPEMFRHDPDINYDGTVNMADAVIISSILRGSTDIDSYYINSADINNDGVIDELDYMTVCMNIKGYVNNIKSVTVNLNSCNDGADCYVKIMSGKDLSDLNGEILLQKNVFGKYISIVVNSIDADGLYYIFNEKYAVDSGKKYRLVADILYDNRRITADDSCIIT